MQNELKGTLKSHLITIANCMHRIWGVLCLLKYVRIWILHAFIVGMLGRYTVADPETPREGGGGGRIR